MICTVCNASYESETKLRDHQKMSHRGYGAKENTQAADIKQPEDPRV
jgi:hypothetical protein